MSKDELQPPRCDFHDEEEIASAVCITHQNLLCFSCVLDKARSSPSCNIKPLDKITDDKIGTVVEYLCIKQFVCMKKLQLTGNEKTIADLRGRLGNEISEKYERLKGHLKELKNKSFTSLESKTGDILNMLNNKKASLNSLEADINSHLEKLSVDTDEDIADSKAQLKTIAPKVMKSVSEEPYIPQGKFLYNQKLENALLKCESGLGDIQLVDLYDYEYLDNFNRDSQLQKQSKENGNENIQSKPPQVKPRIPMNSKYLPQENIELSSEGRTEPSKDEKQNTPPVPPRLPAKPQNHVPKIKDFSKDVNQSKGDSYSDLKEKISSNEGAHTKNKLDSKKHGLKSRIAKIFSVEKKACSDIDTVNTEANISESLVEALEITAHTEQEQAYEVYADVEFPESNGIKPKQLINRTITVTGLNQTRPIWNFSKIVSLGESDIGLFSETKSPVIVIIGLDGSVKCQKTFSDKIAGIVATGRNQIALVLKKKAIIKRLKMTNGCLQEERNFHFCPREQIVNITGFDYNIQQSMFAISSPCELVILDADGKIVKTVSIAISENCDLVTSYNFKEDCVYVLNIEHNTLKCFSYASSSAMWAKKIDKSDFLARDMGFYSDKLYVSGKNYIAVFAAMDGTSINTISTNDLLEDCLGVCALDDVIVFSSDSDDSQKAQTLAFVAL